jgi:hypothetical protein
MVRMENDEVRTEIGDQGLVGEELQDKLDVAPSEERFATLPEQASFSFG